MQVYSLYSSFMKLVIFIPFLLILYLIYTLFRNIETIGIPSLLITMAIGIILYITFFHKAFFGRIKTKGNNIFLENGLNKKSWNISDLTRIECHKADNYGIITINFTLTTKEKSYSFNGSNEKIVKWLKELQVNEKIIDSSLVI